MFPSAWKSLLANPSFQEGGGGSKLPLRYEAPLRPLIHPRTKKGPVPQPWGAGFLLCGILNDRGQTPARARLSCTLRNGFGVHSARGAGQAAARNGKAWCRTVMAGDTSEAEIEIAWPMIGAATARRAQDVGWTRGKIFDSNISSTDSFVASSFSSGRKHLTRLTIPPRQAASHPLVVRRAESPNRHFDSCVRNQMRHYRLCKTTGVALDMVETRGGTASGEGPPSALWKPGIRRDRHWNGAAKALS